MVGFIFRGSIDLFLFLFTGLNVVSLFRNTKSRPQLKMYMRQNCYFL
ncbi:RNA-binding (RRM/RBD/RNP motifs) family protein [Zea mays]|uniref:RNA-binding (RRM/RBD/RNP motifs) family protein n=1 Tax=Zea mays TaxID=4577 RepID=A0A1D6K8I9_MAIZE|nr:RNA-binding (RRM/RBD/RNP motifs) family protein [Zea mays]